MRRTHADRIMAVVMLTAFGAGMAQGTDDAVTAETRRVFEAYAVAHDASHYAEDATFTDMTNPGQPLVGREAIAAMLGTFYGGAFSEAHGSEDELLIDGNRVMLEFTFTGTHTGDFYGIPATGRQVELQLMSVYHVEDGLIRWARLYYDSASMLRQLGVIE